MEHIESFIDAILDGDYELAYDKIWILLGAGVVAILALGSYLGASLIVFFKSMKVWGMLGGLLSGFVKLTGESKFLMYLRDSKRLSPIPEPKTPADFQKISSDIYQHVRMYNDSLTESKIAFRGPYGASFKLANDFRIEYTENLLSMKQCINELASDSDEYMKVYNRYKDDLTVSRKYHLRSKHAAQDLLDDYRFDIQNIGFLRFPLVIWPFGKTSKDLRRLKRSLKQENKSLKKHNKALKTLDKDIFNKHRKGLLLNVRKFIRSDEENLRDEIHTLAADWITLEMMIKSGSLFDDLIKSDNEESIAIRKKIELPNDFPLDDTDAAREFMLNYLNNKAPLSCTPAKEDILECFLRAWLLGHNIDYLNAEYIYSLPSAGALGYAEKIYGIQQSNKTNWLMHFAVKHNEVEIRDPYTGKHINKKIHPFKRKLTPTR